MRITKGQLRRIIREEVNRVNRVNRADRARQLREAAGPDYKGAMYSMDRWMPDDPDLMDEFYDAEAIGDRGRLLDVLLSADEDRFYDIAGPGASLEGFVDWMLSS